MEMDLWTEVLSFELADIFDVSVTATKIRLRNLGLIRENLMNQQTFIK